MDKNIYNSNPKRCLHCNRIIPYEKRENIYCDHSCSASKNNKGICRNKLYYDKLRGGLPKIVHIKRKPKADIYCKFCNKLLHPSHPKVEFCNNTCSNLYKTLKMICDKTANRHNKKRIKFYLIQTRGHKCERCKLSVWTDHKIPLEIHHEDGNIDNMDLSNIKLLCPNCHVFTDTYKFKNFKYKSRNCL